MTPGRQIAATLGVKVTDVTKVLKDPEGSKVSPSVKQKILDHLARQARLPSGPTRGRNLFLILPTATARVGRSDYFQSLKDGLFESLEPAAAARNRDLVVKIYRPETEESIMKIPAWGVIVSTRIPSHILGAWSKRFPVVTLNQTFGSLGEYPPWDRVSVDNPQGMEMLVEHLTLLGHRRIAYVGLLSDPGSRDAHQHFLERQDGLCQALRRRGLPIRPEHLVQFPGQDQRAMNDFVVRKVLRGPGAPTALCFANDDQACNFITFARHMGLDVPGRVSVAGFDGAEQGSQSNPSLTTLAQDFDALARAAFSIIEERNRSGVRLSKWSVRLAPKLLIRESTARPRGDAAAFGEDKKKSRAKKKKGSPRKQEIPEAV